MNTRAITVEVPSDILLALNSSEEELKQSIKSALVIRLYRQEKLKTSESCQDNEKRPDDLRLKSVDFVCSC
jgi:hypothetical protein